jgi:hypothetical protein
MGRERCGCRFWVGVICFGWAVIASGRKESEGWCFLLESF